MSWLFPGREVRIDCPCLDCCDPISLCMKDGQILALDPPSTVGYSKLPVWRWRDNFGYAWGRMHLFRSEEHARRWIDFDPENEEGIRLVADVHALFSRPLFRERLSPDYVLRLREHVRGYHEGLEQIGKGSTSWAEKAPS